ncbi:MAG: Crp/Fnr family transcriptional regulator [Bacteroidota bacterium]
MANLEKLRKKLCSYNQLTEEDLSYALQFYKEKRVAKGDFLLQTGQMVNHFYYLEQGCICYYLLKDGSEKVMEFFTEDDMFTDLYAYIEEIPANAFLRAEEDCRLFYISKQDVTRSFDHSHPLERSGRLSMQDAFVKAFRRITHLNNLSNEERYLRLLEKRPELFQRVPQYLIASYLGLSPVGLSKIRKRLKQS